MDIYEVFEAVPREDFLPEEYRSRAHEDRPLPIGYGQTNSQPTTVRQMLEWLDVEPEQKVLDVGSGSGWTTALLARLVGPKGRIYAVELLPELVDMGRTNCERSGVMNAAFYTASGTFGLPDHGPYDRILVNASAGRIPEDLLSQLRKPGKLVIPVGETIHVIEKEDNGNVTDELHYGYIFVPLISKP